MNEKYLVQPANETEVGETEEKGAFDRYEKSLTEQSEYFSEQAKYIRLRIMELQSSGALPSEPMREQDRINLVQTFIQALDRGLCFDDDDSKILWIARSAKSIYDANVK